MFRHMRPILAAKRDQLITLVGALHGLLENRADAAEVVLVVEYSRLERRPLFRQKRMLGRAVRHAHRAVQLQDLEVVLSLALQELLPGGLPDLRLGVHEDAWFRAVDASGPAALGCLDLAVLVQLRRLLAVQPDVAVVVLRVPVGRALLEAAPQIELVVDRGATRTVDRARAVRHPHDLARRLAVLDAPVDPDRSRPEWEPLVRDLRGEPRRGRAAARGN